MKNIAPDPKTGEITIEDVFINATPNTSKQAKKQLRKRGLRPFDFIIDWDGILVKCQIPPDFDAIQDKQRLIIEKAQELQAAAKGAGPTDAATGEISSDTLSKLNNVLSEGGEIAKMTLAYSYLVVFKFVKSWENGPWEFNPDTWEQEVFDLEAQDVQALATEISQRAVLSKAEADFLANPSFS